MSAAIRQAIASAASTVEGIDCQPYFVPSTSIGSAMVRLDNITYPNPFGGICHWNVIVMLSQDHAEAEKYVDEKVPLIRQALSDELVVTEVKPQRLEIKGVGILPCVFINGHREEE